MPIVTVFEFPGEDIAKYHKVFEAGGPAILEQPARVSHICYRTEGGFTVVDVWEDEASLPRSATSSARPPRRPVWTPSPPCTRSKALSHRTGPAPPTEFPRSIR